MSGLNKYKSKLQRLSKALTSNEALKRRIQTRASLQAEADLKERVFYKGLATDGSKIGKYSTNEFYFNPKNAINLPKSKLKPRGKNGKSAFKNGNKKKTVYLDTGYKEFRQKVGRQNNFVDLNLTGASEKTIQTGLKGSNVVLGFTNKERLNILLSNEERFNKEIFKLSQEERGAAIEAAIDEINILVKELFNFV